MLRNMSIGRWIGIALMAMVVVAIWKANNGDLSVMISAVWTAINNGAQILLDMWNKFIGSGEAQSILSGTGSGS